MKSRSEQQHDIIVGELEKLLFHRADYDEMKTFFEYCRNGEIGEVDLLGIADDIYDFYEVKLSNCTKSRNRAREQYSRFKRAYSDKRTNGFFYSVDGVVRRIQ